MPSAQPGGQCHGPSCKQHKWGRCTAHARRQAGSGACLYLKMFWPTNCKQLLEVLIKQRKKLISTVRSATERVSATQKKGRKKKTHWAKLKGLRVCDANFSGLWRLHNSQATTTGCTSQMSIRCLADRNTAVYEIRSKPIRLAKYLALQTVFTLSSVLKPADTIKIFTPSGTAGMENEDS